MNRTLVPSEIMHKDRRLPMEAIQVLIALSNRVRSGSHNECWPSNRRIVEDTGLDSGSVRRAIRGLVARGYVERKTRAGKGGVNVYVLTFITKADALPGGSSPGATAPGRDSPPSQGGSAPFTPGGSAPLKHDKGKHVKEALQEREPANAEALSPQVGGVGDADRSRFLDAWDARLRAMGLAALTTPARRNFGKALAGIIRGEQKTWTYLAAEAEAWCADPWARREGFPWKTFIIEDQRTRALARGCNGTGDGEDPFMAAAEATAGEV